VVAARLSEDPAASVSLRVRGMAALRVADASAFPSLTTVNPMVAVPMLAERAAGLIRSAGRSLTRAVTPVTY
jgi:choline dehydrogenase-like flavoprotein